MTFLYNGINYGISIELSMLYFSGSPLIPVPLVVKGGRISKGLQNVCWDPMPHTLVASWSHEMSGL